MNKLVQTTIGALLLAAPSQAQGTFSYTKNYFCQPPTVSYLEVFPSLNEATNTVSLDIEHYDLYASQGPGVPDSTFSVLFYETNITPRPPIVGTGSLCLPNPSVLSVVVYNPSDLVAWHSASMPLPQFSSRTHFFQAYNRLSPTPTNAIAVFTN